VRNLDRAVKPRSQRSVFDLPKLDATAAPQLAEMPETII
jgi:hypothetical protein